MTQVQWNKQFLALRSALVDDLKDRNGNKLHLTVSALMKVAKKHIPDFEYTHTMRSRIRELFSEVDVRAVLGRHTANFIYLKPVDVPKEQWSAIIANGVDSIIAFMESRKAYEYGKYTAEVARKSAEYRESPEGKAQAEKTEQRRKDNQRMTDEGFAVLRKLAANDWPEQKAAHGVDQPVGALAAQVFTWLASLIDSVDFVGVDWSAAELSELLESFGYIESQYTNQPKKIYDLATWRAYIAGQCINCLRPAPAGFGRIPPFAVYKIKERGLDTETFTPVSRNFPKQRELSQYERKQLLDKKLDEGARTWNSDSETFEEYLTALEIPTHVDEVVC